VTKAATTLDWDVEQLTVILEPPSAWQLVAAGPGAGKSAVACQRVAYLIDEGVPPSRILLVSFTRTAVAELRDRIVSYAVASDRARSVRIATIDSHAWSLRTQLDDEPVPKVLAESAYELSIQRTLELFRSNNADLIDFMSRLEHLIIDEAQDVMGVRADLIIAMLRTLAEPCGVTILADPSQAIYGFTTDEEDHGGTAASLLTRLVQECPRSLTPRLLNKAHRIENDQLVELFLRARKEIELAGDAEGHVDRVKEAIRETCGEDIGVTKHKSVASFLAGHVGESMLVLFKRRADVIVASSYCSDAGIEHRLRMSNLPVVVRPWLGWLLGETVQSFIGRDDFDRLWGVRSGLAPPAFIGERRDDAWDVLHHFAAASRPRTIDLVELRRVVARARPPIDFCYPELGASGPILGTIHASKGREADTVVLFMAPQGVERASVVETRALDERGQAASGRGHVFRRAGANDIANRVESPPESDAKTRASSIAFELGRVYYVGATRARKMLYVAETNGWGVDYLDSKRVFCRHPSDTARAQLELGRDGDVDPVAHLAWSNGVELQGHLAQSIGKTLSIQARSQATEAAYGKMDYVWRLFLETKAEGVTRVLDIGQLSETFNRDLGQLWSCVDSGKRLRPHGLINNIFLVGITTVCLNGSQRDSVKAPFNRSGFALAPVVKGFPMISFDYRKFGRKLE
jgi:hypothetical protein